MLLVFHPETLLVVPVLVPPSLPPRYPLLAVEVETEARGAGIYAVGTSMTREEHAGGSFTRKIKK